MALVLAGSLLGFMAALLGFFLGLPTAAALLIWALSGPAWALVALLLALPRAMREPVPPLAA